jgi:nitrate reductase beta subunit
MMNTELERQKRLVTSKRRTLAEYMVAKRHPTLSNNDDLSGSIRQEDLVESQLKQIINKEYKKRIFLILRRDIKGAINPASIIRSPMASIDVTLEDGTVIAKTTKEGIEEHLLERNPKVYIAAGLTPF